MTDGRVGVCAYSWPVGCVCVVTVIHGSDSAVDVDVVGWFAPVSHLAVVCTSQRNPTGKQVDQ